MIREERLRGREARDNVRTYFDHEKLDVYQLELQFITWVTPLIAKVKQRPSEARIAEVLDQLDRASLSALLNTAEGNARRQRRRRAKFFDDAVVQTVHAQHVWSRRGR